MAHNNDKIRMHMLQKNHYAYLELHAKGAKFLIRVKSGRFKWEQLSLFISNSPSAELESVDLA